MKDYILEKFFYWAKMIILACVLVFIIRGFLFIPMKVDGNSMETTLKPNDQLVYEKISKIKRFDVIIFENEDGSIYIKRVIGLPGEHIKYEDDELYVNGNKVEEDFLGQAKIKRDSNQYTTNFDLKEMTNQETLSDDGYFVLGDNRRLSKDSRSFGEIKADRIIGKARFIYYPLKNLGRIK